MITIYLGDITEYLVQQARKNDPAAQLLDRNNFKNIKPGVYYTSLGDLDSLSNLGATLLQADKIIYTPPAKWSDEFKGTSKMKEWYTDYLNVFKFRCEVENYSSQQEFDQILTFADTRKTQEPQLWVAGCSISHGVGVNIYTRYGQLLANQLDLDVSFLTHSGSSITWAADQILRSDIKPGDTVVWGLTSSARLSMFNKDTVAYLNINTPNLDKTTANFIASDHTTYQSVTSVLQVINFCQKINVKLVIASLVDDYIINYIQNFPGLINLYKLWGRNPDEMFIDLGEDNGHPGVKTHQFYAEQIYQKIQQLDHNCAIIQHGINT